MVLRQISVIIFSADMGYTAEVLDPMEYFTVFMYVRLQGQFVTHFTNI